MSDAAAFPLTWPPGWPRTPASQRKAPRFTSADTAAYSPKSRTEIRVVDARKRLADELDILGAQYVTLSTNMELRADGQLRANAPAPDDPGAAIYFRLRGRPIVLACDKWKTVAGNLAAIAAHIGALRAQERWGVGSIEQAFNGYSALPAPMVVNDWRTVLGSPATLAEAEAAYRRQIVAAHPDAGGSHARAAALNAAIAEARRALR